MGKSRAMKPQLFVQTWKIWARQLGVRRCCGGKSESSSGVQTHLTLKLLGGEKRIVEDEEMGIAKRVIPKKRHEEGGGYHWKTKPSWSDYTRSFGQDRK